MAVVQVMGATGALGALGKAPSKGGFFANLTKAVGNAGNWFATNSGGLINTLDAYGRLKSGAKVQTNLVEKSWEDNVRNTPPASWFDQSTVFPGVQNSIVAMGGAAGLGLVLLLLMRKPEVSR